MDANNGGKKNLTPLRKAVNYLIGKGVIQTDSDLGKEFNLSPGTISTYLNGKPGKEFVRNFETKFKINLKDFEGEFKGESKKNELYGITMPETIQLIMNMYAMNKVILSGIAEILANQKEKNVTLVLAELEEAVRLWQEEAQNKFS